ncbi:hypothetical protein HDV05_008546 [Chytridiales sp. JEL 0842]|nr:hypothetical protein HDV05_008546 [Chytridiales sp. JEL 0842]
MPPTTDEHKNRQGAVISSLEAQLQNTIDSRIAKGLLRSLTLSPEHFIDFSSNDYLGLSRHAGLHQDFVDALAAPPDAYCTISMFDNNSAVIKRASSSASDFKSLRISADHAADLTSKDPPHPTSTISRTSETSNLRLESSRYQMGSTGSRLLTGNTAMAHSLESELAQFHNAESALLFNSGYDANLSLFSTLPQVGSSVVYDELIHASVHDGFKTCRAAKVRAFKHNDMDSFKTVVMEEVVRIERAVAAGKAGLSAKSILPGIIVGVESIYSMDGDEAPLVEMVEFIDSIGTRAGGVYLVVDEAHSTGIRGPEGRGLVSMLGLEKKIFARLHTFGKAVGAHGAAILGPAVLKSYLLNYARPLIYSTSLPIHSLIGIKLSYKWMAKEAQLLQTYLDKLIHHFHLTFGAFNFPPGMEMIPSHSPIQGIVIPGNDQVVYVSKYLRSKGFDIRPIRFPTVPKGAERLRICLHAHNKLEDVEKLAVELGVVLSHPEALQNQKPAKL